MKKTTKYSVALVGTTLLSNPSVATLSSDNSLLEIPSATTQDSFLSKIPADLRVMTRNFKSVRGSRGGNSSIVTSGSVGHEAGSPGSTTTTTPSPSSCNMSTNLLEFTPLKAVYIVGEEIVLNLYEHVHTCTRFHRVDLWVAVEIPSGELYFRTPSWFSPFELSPQPFKRSLENSEATHAILSFEVVPGMGGTYTFYALFAQEGTNPITDGFIVQRSNLAIISTTLANY